jgi:hypothetical protein
VARYCRGEHGRLAAHRLQAAVQQVPADHALAAVVVDHELPGEVLLVDGDVPLHQLLVEHLDQDVTGDVGRVDGPRRAGRPEGTLRHPAVVAPGEVGAPVVELVDVERGLVAQDLDRVLVAEEVGALDGVVGVLLGIVVAGVPERRVDPALRGPGVAAGRVELRDHADVGSGIECGDGGAHSGATGPHDEHVVLRLHC